MIIGIDASRANHDQKTGVEWYAWHLIQQLKKIVPDTDQVILYSDKPLTGELATLPPHWSSRVLRWPPRRLWTQVRLSFEMLIRPPDVLFVPAHVFPVIHPKKTIMTVHDVAALRFPETYSWFERWYSIWSAKAAVKKLSTIIVPSEFTKQELLKRTAHCLARGTNITVIPHGYDERYKVIDDDKYIETILQKYHLTQPFFLGVGRLEEKKNTRRLIEAFSLIGQLPPYATYRLVLIGKPGYGYDKVAAALAASPVQDRIITPGWVDGDDMPAIMNAAEVLVFPSLYEGFGMPMLEAFASGTPVIAARGSSLEEVGGEACLYVDPQRVEDIVKKITVLEDISLRMNLVAQGLQRVQQYSWQHAGEQTLAVLKKI